MLKFFLLPALISCSLISTPIHQMKGGYEDNLEQLDLHNSFAFVSEGKEYYFARKSQYEGDREECSYFVGFVDNQLRYSFPVTAFNELNSIYELNATPEEKMKKVISKFDDFSQHPRECTKIPSKGEQVEEFIGNMIWPGSLLVVLWPITVAMIVSEITSTDSLRLGQQLHEVQYLLSSHASHIRKENDRSYYVFDRKQERIVTYFEEGKLKAWVRGQKPP